MDPSLKGQPLVVGGLAEERGVVAAASYPAREFGIHSAMSMFKAQKLCSDLVIKPPRFKAYRTYSKIIMGILRSHSDQVQQVSVDEAYLDLSDCLEHWDDGIAAVKNIQHRIKRDIGLSVSVGLSTNKMIAKIASDFEKPEGMTIVAPGKEKSFLAPLTVNKIPGIGPKTADKLKSMGVVTVNDLQSQSELVLIKVFGKMGRDMYRWSRGFDDRAVCEEQAAKSISTERTFKDDIDSEDELLDKLDHMSAEVATQLNRNNFKGKTITVKIRYLDFKTITRQLSISTYTCSEKEIARAARDLFLKEWKSARPIRLLGVGVSNFEPVISQLALNFNGK